MLERGYAYISSSSVIFQKRSFTIAHFGYVYLPMVTGKAFDLGYVTRLVYFLGLMVSSIEKIEQEGCKKEVEGTTRV